MSEHSQDLLFHLEANIHPVGFVGRHAADVLAGDFGVIDQLFDALGGVDAPVITISTYRTRNRIIITIQDNGSGIPEEQKGQRAP
jgi:DNA topoisomerase VI subunit B